MRNGLFSLAVLTVLAPFGLGLGLAGAADGDGGRVVLRFADPELVESSGLLVAGDHFVTVNDSGDSARVFTVAGDGSTAAVTTWDADVQDVESVASAGGDAVWVADIGDNRRSRSETTLWRVPLVSGSVEATPYQLSYADGARDAETLVAEPGTGRLFVVSKGVFGGGVYAAPAELATDQVNRLEALGPVAGMVTDGAFFPDGRHLLLRNYTHAFVYAWPSLDLVGDFDLPDQRQGEGLAIAADGRIYVSSEGRNAPLLEVELPSPVRQAMTDPPEPVASAPESPESPGSPGSPGSPESSDEPSPPTSPAPPSASDSAEGEEEAGRAAPPSDEVVDAGRTGWIIGGLVFVGAVVIGIRALRPR